MFSAFLLFTLFFLGKCLELTCRFNLKRVAKLSTIAHQWPPAYQHKRGREWCEVSSRQQRTKLKPHYDVGESPRRTAFPFRVFNHESHPRSNDNASPFCSTFPRLRTTSSGDCRLRPAGAERSSFGNAISGWAVRLYASNQNKRTQSRTSRVEKQLCLAKAQLFFMTFRELRLTRRINICVLAKLLLPAWEDGSRGGDQNKTTYELSSRSRPTLYIRMTLLPSTVPDLGRPTQTKAVADFQAEP
jgi:hypothetical protein